MRSGGCCWEAVCAWAAPSTPPPSSSQAGSPPPDAGDDAWGDAEAEAADNKAIASLWQAAEVLVADGDGAARDALCVLQTVEGLGNYWSVHKLRSVREATGMRELGPEWRPPAEPEAAPRARVPVERGKPAAKARRVPFVGDEPVTVSVPRSSPASLDDWVGVYIVASAERRGMVDIDPHLDFLPTGVDLRAPARVPASYLRLVGAEAEDGPCGPRDDGARPSPVAAAGQTARKRERTEDAATGATPPHGAAEKQQRRRDPPGSAMSGAVKDILSALEVLTSRPGGATANFVLFFEDVATQLRHAAGRAAKEGRPMCPERLAELLAALADGAQKPEAGAGGAGLLACELHGVVSAFCQTAAAGAHGAGPPSADHLDDTIAYVRTFEYRSVTEATLRIDEYATEGPAATALTASGATSAEALCFSTGGSVLSTVELLVRTQESTAGSRERSRMRNDRGIFAATGKHKPPSRGAVAKAAAGPWGVGPPSRGRLFPTDLPPGGAAVALTPNERVAPGDTLQVSFSAPGPAGACAQRARVLCTTESARGYTVATVRWQQGGEVAELVCGVDVYERQGTYTEYLNMGDGPQQRLVLDSFCRNAPDGARWWGNGGGRRAGRCPGLDDAAGAVLRAGVAAAPGVIPSPPTGVPADVAAALYHICFDTAWCN